MVIHIHVYIYISWSYKGCKWLYIYIYNDKALYQLYMVRNGYKLGYHPFHKLGDLLT